MLSDFINWLQKHDSEATFREVADILWLAEHIKPSSAFARDSSNSSAALLNEPPGNRTDPASSGTGQYSSIDGGVGEESKKEGWEVGLADGTSQETASRVSIFRLPGLAALPDKLKVARALRPLMRQVLSYTERVLDEAATAERIAESRLWLPVLAPARERWLDLALVVDQSSSMVIWEAVASELQRLLARLGAFQDVHTWRLLTDAPEGVLKLQAGPRSNSSPRRLSELRDPGGRRLVLVLSDCVSEGWKSGYVFEYLASLGHTGPVAVVQLLQEEMWPDTALMHGEKVELSLEAGSPANSRLQALSEDYFGQSEKREWDRQVEFALPVVSLEPSRLGKWVEMLAGSGSPHVRGYIVPTAAEVDGFVVEQVETLNLPDAQDLLDDFQHHSSDLAQRLAVMLAGAPVLSLPLVRLLQHLLLPQSDQRHLAELFLSGLLMQRSPRAHETQPDTLVYEFAPGVKELLARSLPLYAERLTRQALTGFIEKEARPEQIREFLAYLPDETGDILLDTQLRHFASVSRQTLARWKDLFKNKPTKQVAFPVPPVQPISLPTEPVSGLEATNAEETSALEPELHISRAKEALSRGELVLGDILQTEVATIVHPTSLEVDFEDEVGSPLSENLDEQMPTNLRLRTESVPSTKLKIFLCHSSGNKLQIRQLYERLQAESWIQPWLDEEDLIPGQDWLEEIEKVVEQSHIILVCLSPDALTKEGYFQREIQVALNRANHLPEGTINVIPLKLRPCDVPPRLSQWQWVDYFEERGHQNLLRGLRLRAEKLGIKLDVPIMSNNSGDQKLELGNYLLSLRERTHLSRQELGKRLNPPVSATTIGNWEIGVAAPKNPNLQHLAEFYLVKGIFTVGTESTEIRDMWRLAGRSLEFNETWLRDLLEKKAFQNEHTSQSGPPVDSERNSRLSYLIASLNDLDVKVRRQAAKSIGQLKESQAIDPLTAALKDPDEEVRWRSAFALGEIGDVRALDALMELVGKGNSTPMDWFRVQLSADRDAARVAIKQIKKQTG